MKWQNVLLDKKDKIGTITLNRPEKYNAFSDRMREEVLEAVEDASVDKEVRVVVITGAGKAFCSGGDVEEFVSGKTQALSKTSPSDRYIFQKIVLAINSAEKPFIAAVNGVAAGGGIGLALSCDILIASEKAKFSQIFIRRGAYPDWGAAYFMYRLVGYAKAAELIFTGDLIAAQEALRIGLVNHLVPHEELMPYTYGLAKRIAVNAPTPIVIAKRGLQNYYRMDLSQALDYEAYAVGVCRETEDFMEGFKSFLEKREPVFRGK
jgi:2-(1,2-epoxy-1,2-dihydrophenyl)acetyl-CoA isomerase